MKNHLLFITFSALLFAGCQQEKAHVAKPNFSEARFAEYVKTLASDEFEGRAPSSAGEVKTIEYLTEAFTAIGLDPAGHNNSWTQEVPLMAITASPEMQLTITGNGKTTTAAYGPDMMAWTKRVVPNVEVKDAELVFVGYGIVAPEFDWNDYAGVDMKGKTAVIMVNDPGFATGDDNLFTGNAMTYYGRWTYKFEEAARQGAEAAIIIHETAPASYPWEVVSGSWSGPQFGLVAEDENMSRAAVEGWVTHDIAVQLFDQAGMDYEMLTAEAAKPGFAPKAMGIEANIAISNEVQRSVSSNFFAMIEGSTRPDEYIIYTGHWDHLGKDESLEGDQIYNGAVDNATGIAALIEMANAFMKAENKPERTIIFLAVTAEEQGLIGSAYYAEAPIYPLNKTAAVINIDAMNVNGAMKDIVVVGYGNSELDDYADRFANAAGRTVLPDPNPEKGYFFRSDHFSFAKKGVPALYMEGGSDAVNGGVEQAKAWAADYTANRYHKPADEYSDDWDLAGIIQDMTLLYQIGDKLANETTFPNYREGNAFRSIRDASRAGH